MSTTVSYKGATIATVSNNTKTLLTEGKYLEDDITLVDVSGGGAVLTTKNISANGTYNASSDSADGYSQVAVAVPASAVDSGKKNITANGNGQDVVGYAAVDVAVPNSYSAGDEGKVVSNSALVAQTAHADVTPTTSDQTIDTTLNNSLKVKGDANLVAGNIKKDVEIFGTTGSYEGGGGGSGLTTIASGTFVGMGNVPSSAWTGVRVGKKMPKTDFWFKFTAKPTSEFPYDTDYKYLYGASIVFSEYAHYDLSSVGNSKTPISDISADINNGGEITTAAAGHFIGSIAQVRNNTANTISRPNSCTIDMNTTDGFCVRFYTSNPLNKLPTTITYDWELVYFGTNPATDIVDLS